MKQTFEPRIAQPTNCALRAAIPFENGRREERVALRTIQNNNQSSTLALVEKVRVA
jgi:hypothetical protein